MWFHAITDYGDSKRYWWNRSRDELITDLIIPLFSKQVVIANHRGKKSLFNFGAVSYATIIKTDSKLERPGKGKVPEELKDDDFIKEHNATQEFLNEIRILQSTPATRSLLQQAILEPKNQIFVIMKFNDPLLDSAYEGVIKPLGIEFGYNVLRVDEIQNSGNITTQILENIASSKIIIADLSGERPNCYYEAGYAHALGKDIIFCIKTGDIIHFDLASYRFIQWSTEAELRRKLKERLKAIIQSDKEEED